MHVTSEEGIFAYRKTFKKHSRGFEGMQLAEAEPSEPSVCGVYFLTDPDKVVEVEIEFMDVSCELGGLLGVRQEILNFMSLYLFQYFLSLSMDGSLMVNTFPEFTTMNLV